MREESSYLKNGAEEKSETEQQVQSMGMGLRTQAEKGDNMGLAQWEWPALSRRQAGGDKE